MSINFSLQQSIQNYEINESHIQSPESKRRKADEIDRVYVCQYKKCQKSYGSYPALYTHIKLKHSNQVKKGGSNRLPAKNLKYIKKISIQKSRKDLSTTQSTPELAEKKQVCEAKFDYQNLPELYNDLLSTLAMIQCLQESKVQLEQPIKQLFPLDLQQSSEEFPEIQTLNQDILSPLKSELYVIKQSPQTFARFSASTAGIAHKLAELLAFLGNKIKQELYQEFCYFLGFFAKCITLRKISNIQSAQEDFEEIYQYIHDSIGYCTTFKFKYLKNGKIAENKDQIMQLSKKLIMIIIQVTLQKMEEKGIPPFILA